MQAPRQTHSSGLEKGGDCPKIQETFQSSKNGSVKVPCSQGKDHAPINRAIVINGELASVKIESGKLTGKFISLQKNLISFERLNILGKSYPASLNYLDN